MKKTVWSLLLGMILLVGISITAMSFAASAETSGDYTYTVLANGTVSITKYTGSATSVVIPDLLDGYKVSQIGNNAFQTTKIKTVTFPSTIKKIGVNAFLDCKSLKSITIPAGVTRIEAGTFSGCTSLKTVLLHDGITVIGSSAFAECAIETIKLPANVKKLAYGTFHSCKKLTSVQLPSKLEKIQHTVFEGCTSLKSITIPANVTSIHPEAFASDYYGTSKFSSITVDKGNKTYCSIDGVLFSKDKTRLYIYPSAKKATYYWVPNGVTVIEESAFDNNHLKTIGLPASLKSIKESAFNSKSLKEVLFKGTQAQWKKVKRANNNHALYNATVYYNAKELMIKVQPQSVGVAIGKTAKVKVSAFGQGLTYKWYYKDKGGSKYTYTSSFKGASYSVTMTKARAERKVYCVITDSKGRKVKTDVVTLGKAVTVSKQTPKAICVKGGKNASVTFKVSGVGVKYKWYYKDVNDSAYKVTTSFKGSKYSVTMNEARAGRKVYCVATDKYGKQVKSNVTTLDHAVKITKQLKDLASRPGQYFATNVEAIGEGLTYKWYFKNKGDTTYHYTSTFQSNIYHAQMTAACADRSIYCVITDKYGNQVKSAVAVLHDNAVTVQRDSSVSVAAKGELLTLSVTATGDGLTYEWRYSDERGRYHLIPGVSGNTCSFIMDETWAARDIECSVHDKYGNSQAVFFNPEMV